MLDNYFKWWRRRRILSGGEGWGGGGGVKIWKCLDSRTTIQRGASHPLVLRNTLLPRKHRKCNCATQVSTKCALRQVKPNVHNIRSGSRAPKCIQGSHHLPSLLCSYQVWWAFHLLENFRNCIYQKVIEGLQWNQSFEIIDQRQQFHFSTLVKLKDPNYFGQGCLPFGLGWVHWNRR